MRRVRSTNPPTGSLRIVSPALRIIAPHLRSRLEPLLSSAASSDKFHDRFLIIDKTTLIHVGASLNHLGKKCFAFSSLDKSNIPDILAKL